MAMVMLIYLHNTGTTTVTNYVFTDIYTRQISHILPTLSARKVTVSPVTLQKNNNDQETKINPHKLKSHKIGLRFRMN